MSKWLRHSRNLFVAMLGVIYTLLLYKSILSPGNRQFNIALALLPVALFLFLAIWGNRYRFILLAILLLSAGSVWHFWHETLLDHYHWFYLLQHVAVNGALAFLFGRTLLPGRTPLVTRFAAIVHGEMPPEQVRYTHQVTAAWTLFFISVALLSFVLFLATPLEVWGFFANIISPVLMGAMFAGEYLVRLHRLPNVKHVNLIESIRISSKYFRESHQKAQP